MNLNKHVTEKAKLNFITAIFRYIYFVIAVAC